jgi:murein L,D-transpeptidase YcbB/YkuD
VGRRRTPYGVALCLLLTGALAAPADPDWHIPQAPADAPAPEHPGFLRLETALTAYRELAATDGWPALPEGPVLEAGVRDARVATLRARLRRTGEFTAAMDAAMGADAWFFDAALASALRRFQSRHGLPDTGLLTERTRLALNVPADERVRQLEATRTRWLWLPRDFGPRHLFANVPAGRLELVENGTTRLVMRIIAGHPSRPTPTFQDTVRAITVNPPWNVPRRVAVEDLLPGQQADRGYFDRLGIRVLRERDGVVVDAKGIDWQSLGPDNFPYRLVQRPGPLNSLGRLKFVTGNPWDIFLHDTPARGLFDLNSRTLSSGCLRLEAPEALAEILLEGNVPSTKATQTVPLPRPITLYVVYLTSWVDPDGTVQFRPDVYGRDAHLR